MTTIIDKRMVKMVFIVLNVVLILLVLAGAIAQETEAQEPASITVVKEISIDGGVTWMDASTPTGPLILPGSIVQFRFTIRNSGGVVLTDIALMDSVFDVSGALLPASLAPSDPDFVYILANIVATEGQHSNTATASAVYALYLSSTAEVVYASVQDSDMAHYLGYTSPTLPVTSISLKKHISVDGGTTWLDAEAPTGPNVEVGSLLDFRFSITNTGNTALSGLTLTDNVYNLVGLVLPASLAPAATFTYILEDIAAVEGQHSNTATATGTFRQQTVSDSDMAHYLGYTPPTLPVTSISLKKHISVDGGTTWLDAEAPTGPNVEVGSLLDFRFSITNTGNTALSGLTLTDNVFNLDGLVLPASLAPAATFTYILEDIEAVEGQHSNTATATGTFGQQAVSDSDMAHYLGFVPDEPAIDIEKYVSIDGGKNWFDADTAKGPEVPVGKEVQFKFIIRNVGNVTLTKITLNDSVFDLSGLTMPISLAPGATFEYVLKGIKAEKGQHSNTAATTGMHNGITYSDSDRTHYFGVVKETPKTGSHIPIIETASLLIFYGVILFKTSRKIK